MLITDPEAFAKKAREWAIQYAGATGDEKGGSSGGSSLSVQDQEARRKKAEEAEKKAQ